MADPSRDEDAPRRARDARARAAQAFRSAVGAERSAISMQEGTAHKLRRSAELDRSIADRPSTHDPDRWRELAEAAEQRAEAAEDRAEAARQRLRSDGIDPAAEEDTAPPGRQ